MNYTIIPGKRKLKEENPHLDEVDIFYKEALREMALTNHKLTSSHQHKREVPCR